MTQSHGDRPQIPRLPPSSSAPVRPSARPRPLARYRIVLLKEAVQDLMYVVRSVMELTRFPRAEATHKMWEAHHCGRSVLLTTYLERAELFVELFASKGLKVVLEPC